MGAANTFSTTQTLTPTFNTLGVALTVLCSVALAAQRGRLELQLEQAVRDRPR